MNDGHRIIAQLPIEISKEVHRFLWIDVMREFNEKCVFKYSKGEYPLACIQKWVGRFYSSNDMPANETEYIYSAPRLGLWRAQHHEMWSIIGSLMLMMKDECLSIPQTIQYIKSFNEKKKEIDRLKKLILLYDE